MAFLPNLNILLHLLQLYNEKIRITGVFLWIKDPDPADPKTGSESRSATLVDSIQSKTDEFD